MKIAEIKITWCNLVLVKISKKSQKWVTAPVPIIVCVIDYPVYINKRILRRHKEEQMRTHEMAVTVGSRG